MPTPHLIHDGLAIHRFGEGPPIYLMPAPHRFERPGLRSADMLIDGLVALGREVICWDPPGSGHSTRPADVSLEEMYACTHEVLDVLEIEEPIDAVGHSMAGLCVLAKLLE